MDLIENKRIQKLAENFGKILLKRKNLANLKAEDIFNLLEKGALSSEEALFWLSVLAIKNEEKANFDELTGLLNRKPLFETLSFHLDELKEGKLNCLSLLMIDIDHFKKINDGLGHQIGDLVIRKIAEILKKHVKEELVFRYGGEEFIILLPNFELEKALKVAERLRRKIERDKIIELENKNFSNITVSVGVSHLKKEHLSEFPLADFAISDLIKKADSALYKAKQNGRNQVCIG